MTANAQEIPRIPIPPVREELDAECLIITDNFRSSPDRTRLDPLPVDPGDLLVSSRTKATRMCLQSSGAGCCTNEFNVADAVSETFTINPTGGMAAYVGSTRRGASAFCAIQKLSKPIAMSTSG